MVNSSRSDNGCDPGRLSRCDQQLPLPDGQVSDPRSLYIVHPGEQTGLFLNFALESIFPQPEGLRHFQNFFSACHNA
jgi:hypothetical protein